MSETKRNAHKSRTCATRRARQGGKPPTWRALRYPLSLINFFLVKICSFLLIGWKRFLSPAFGPACRFTPTCSEYAREALEKHGFAKGGILAAGRLARCSPLSKGGDDPVP